MIFLAKLIKHRGVYSKDIKENTYEAIKMAIDDPKYLGVEFDIRETIDHEFVIFHNPTLKGKLIREYKFNELPKYIPRLKDILKIKTSKIFLIEIKNITTFTKFLNLLKKFSYQNIYVMSFSNALINKCLIKNRTYKVGILNYVINTEDNLKELDFVCILNNLLNDNLIKSLKDKEIFSYGLLSENTNYKYASVYYITEY